MRKDSSAYVGSPVIRAATTASAAGAGSGSVLHFTEDQLRKGSLAYVGSPIIEAAKAAAAAATAAAGGDDDDDDDDCDSDADTVPECEALKNARRAGLFKNLEVNDDKVDEYDVLTRGLAGGDVGDKENDSGEGGGEEEEEEPARGQGRLKEP